MISRIAIAAMRSAVITVIALASGPSWATEPCMSYEPEVVTLIGTVHDAQAYGAPGYGETPKRDAVERYQSLTLDKPLCVLQGDDELDEAETGVRQVELVFSNDAHQSYGNMHVHVSGTLFHRQNGHHHTKVLLTVQQID